MGCNKYDIVYEIDVDCMASESGEYLRRPDLQPVGSAHWQLSRCALHEGIRVTGSGACGTFVWFAMIISGTTNLEVEERWSKGA